MINFRERIHQLSSAVKGSFFAKAKQSTSKVVIFIVKSLILKRYTVNLLKTGSEHFKSENVELPAPFAYMILFGRTEHFQEEACPGSFD